jgi:YebC/PmpR family DNA-binding regulatory protein
MSGHNKWANIKQRKGSQDAKRSNLFSKLAKEIIVSARQGGGNPDTNSRLRTAIDKARDANMPKDNIEKAIKRGTGEIEGITYEEIVYEGYGSGGVAVIIDITTDNKNRTAAEIRKIFSKHAGNLGEAGCVAWMFDKKGYIAIDAQKYGEEEIMETAIELGADDVRRDGDTIEVITDTEIYSEVVGGLKNKKVEILNSSVTRIPQNKIKVEEGDAIKLLKLFDELDNHDDVQDYSSNADIDEKIIEEYANS